MESLITPHSLPAFPTSYRWCGKSGKTGTIPNNTETGKAGKNGNQFFQPHQL